MRIWLDDIRKMPPCFDVHCKTAKQAIMYITEPEVSFISFDHDLGEDENGTGYDVAKFIEEYAYYGKIKPIKWAIHSANPVGKENIERAMKNAENYWKV